jgi:PRTRC genetic system protein A
MVYYWLFQGVRKTKKEALAYIEWRNEDNVFSVNIPEQEVSEMAVYPKDDGQRDGWIRIAEIHSHHEMKAFFSEDDDADEQGTGLYMVVGDVNQFFPQLRARISVNGSFCEIHPSVVIEMPQQDYPKEWLDRIKVKNNIKKGDTNEIFQEYAC